MAAAELYQNYLASLSDKDRVQLIELIRYSREDLLAARSEEARVRIAEEFIREAHDRLRAARR